MWKTGSVVLAEAVADLRRTWRVLTVADLAYKAIAFALLTPGAMLLLRWLRAGAGAQVLTDVDTLWFFVTTRIGVLVLLLAGALMLAISALELACLMAIGLASARGSQLTARRALLFAAMRAGVVLRLTTRVVVRLIAGAVPLVVPAAAGAWWLLRRHDINYYLAERPVELWVAVTIAVVAAAGLATLLVAAISRWAYALPLILFEDVSPRRALAESARRSLGHRSVIARALALWAIVAAALAAGSSGLLEALGRTVALHLPDSFSVLILFVSLLALLWALAGLAVGVVNVSLLALVLVRLFLRLAPAVDTPLPAELTQRDDSARRSLPARVKVGAAAVAALASLGVGLAVGMVTRRHEPAVVIAHRGASASAPENSLAAFRLAAEEGADFVELDVQESADGVVLVVHDADLMKVAGVPAKIWETTAAELRTVDIGSAVGGEFAGERVPTLAEVLAACRGRVRVIVELKSYGHDQSLEDRVAAIVEEAGMAPDCVFMSLDHDMVRRMQVLRPRWRTGFLVAKALGDAAQLEGDFLAVESRMATARFVRRAHRAGKEVYVWTVNDPAAMLSALSRGVDGLITDRPGLAREVIARRAELTDAQRVLVALFVRLGLGTGDLVPEE